MQKVLYPSFFTKIIEGKGMAQRQYTVKSLKEALFYINIDNEVLGRETHIELKEMKRKTYSKPFEVATNQFGQQ